MRRCMALLLTVVVGCSSGASSSPESSAAAKKALATALDAWKQGRAAALAKGQPPVRFEDDDYRNGLKLLDYRLDHPDRPICPREDVRVTLVLRDRRGQTSEKAVLYQVVVEPAIAVLRSD